jgi:hypothetical protein
MTIPPQSTTTITTQAFIDPLLSGARPSKATLRVVFNARTTRLLFNDDDDGTRVVSSHAPSPVILRSNWR